MNANLEERFECWRHGLRVFWLAVHDALAEIVDVVAEEGRLPSEELK